MRTLPTGSRPTSPSTFEGGDEFDPDTDEIGVDGDVTSKIDMPQ